MLHYAELNLLSLLLSEYVFGYQSQYSNSPIVFALLGNGTCDTVNENLEVSII